MLIDQSVSNHADIIILILQTSDCTPCDYTVLQSTDNDERASIQWVTKDLHQSLTWN